VGSKNLLQQKKQQKSGGESQKEQGFSPGDAAIAPAQQGKKPQHQQYVAAASPGSA